MAWNIKTNSCVTTTTIHAPWTNFVTIKTTSTTAVAKAPTLLITIDFFQPEGAVTSSVTKPDLQVSATASSRSGKGPRAPSLALETDRPSDSRLASWFLSRSLSQW